MKERVTIAIEDRVLREVDHAAKKEGRSRSNYIEWILKDYLEITSQATEPADKTEV